MTSWKYGKAKTIGKVSRYTKRKKVLFLRSNILTTSLFTATT
jgi:hypothetical protein